MEQFFSDGAEAFADTLANRLQGLKPGATLGRMETDALGRTVIDGHEDAGRCLSILGMADAASGQSLRNGFYTGLEMGEGERVPPHLARHRGQPPDAARRVGASGERGRVGRGGLNALPRNGGAMSSVSRLSSPSAGGARSTR